MSSTDLQPSTNDDPLEAELTFDDWTMLGFALIAVICVVVLLAVGV